MAAVLESLCRKGASGVLEVEGNPAGAIYLDQGQITFARSSWVPDLTARLCGALRPSPELRTFLRGSDQSDRNSGALLVRRGYMSENDLRSILRSAVIDALIVLTMPLSGGSSVLDIRFEAPSAHWAAAFLCLSLESVQPDVSRRAAQMARAGVAHTAPIALRDLDRPSARAHPQPVGPRQPRRRRPHASRPGPPVWPFSLRDHYLAWRSHPPRPLRPRASPPPAGTSQFRARRFRRSPRPPCRPLRSHRTL